MSGDYGLGDIRFDGYEPNELANEIDKLRDGPGSESLHRAVDALQTIANSLEETDRVLRVELGKIGVHWEGEASQGGMEATKTAAVYAEDAAPAVTQTAGGVNEQGDTFSHTRNSAPDSETLRGPTKEDGIDRFAGAFGYTTDNAKKVQQTKAAQQEAVNAMNGYSSGSSAALSSYESLPVPPNMGLTATPYQSTSVASVHSTSVDPRSFTPSGGPPAGAPGQTGLSPGGGPNYTGLPGGTSGNPLGDGPHGGQNNPPTSTNPPVGGGRLSGANPITATPGGLPFTGPGAPGGRPGMPFGDVAGVAGLAGATAGGAAVGSGERERSARGGYADTPEGRAARNAARMGGAVAGVPEDEARAARNAEKIGAKPTKSGASMMSPAAAGAKGEDDEEHVRKYGIDSDDVFGDERLVIMPVIGAQEDD